MDKKSPLELATYRQKESVNDVMLGTELSDSQGRKLQDLLESNDKVFSDVWRKTTKIEHKIKLVDEEPVRSKPQPLPYALRQELESETTEILYMAIIQKLSSPFASLMVIVKKKEGSNRICVFFGEVE